MVGFGDVLPLGPRWGDVVPNFVDVKKATFTQNILQTLAMNVERFSETTMYPIYSKSCSLVLH